MSRLLAALLLAAALALSAVTDGQAAGIPGRSSSLAAGSGGTSQYLTAVGPTPTRPKAPLPGAAARTPQVRPQLVRRPPAGSPAPQTPSSTVAVQTLISVGTSSAAAPGVSGQMNLITHDQEVAFDGVSVAPPDTQLAVGPTATVEAVNDMAEIRNRATNATVDFDLNTFFSVPAAFFFSDPKVVYDIAQGRWYLSGLSFDGANDSYLYLAVSTSSDPSATWNTYKVLDQSTTHVLCDQPHLGFSDDKIAIATDEFAVINGQDTFVNDVWIVLDKNALLTGSSSVAEYAHTFGDTNHFSIQPVYSTSSTTTQYMVYLPPNSQSGGFIAVVGNPATGVAWYEANMPVTLAMPPRAPQQGSSSTIDTGDQRFQSAVYRSGTIWIAAGDSCVPRGDTLQRACLRVVVASVIGFPFNNLPGIANEFDVAMFVGGTGDYLYYPALALDTFGTLYLSYTESSTTDFPAVYTSDVLPGAGGQIDQTFLVSAGAGPYVGPPSAIGGSRWGDYSAAAPDPLDPHTVWVTGEKAAFENSHLDDWGTVTATFNIPSCTSASVATTTASPSFPGPTVIFTGSSSGCWRTPEYQFRKLAPNGSWMIVQAYSPNPNFSWDTSQEQVLGTYRFELDVRTQGFVNAFDAVATTSFDLGLGCTAAAVAAAPPGSSRVGTPVTVSATASGPNCASPQFRFWIKAPGAAWVMVQDYSTASTFSWTSPGTTGTYYLGVHARAAGSSLAYESVASIPYSLTPTTCTGVTESAAPPSPAAAGTQVTITAVAAGCPNPLYEFWMLAQGSKSWQLIRGYSGSPTYSWNSTGALAGTEQFGVWVRDASSPAAYDIYTSIPYAVTTPSCASVTLSAAPPSPSAHGTGVQVTFTAVPAGCTNPNPQYEFWMLAQRSSTWQLVRGYSTSATFIWNTNGAPTSTEIFGVWIRDAGSSAPYDNYNSIPYSLT